MPCGKVAFPSLFYTVLAFSHWNFDTWGRILLSFFFLFLRAIASKLPYAKSSRLNARNQTRRFATTRGVRASVVLLHFHFEQMREMNRIIFNSTYRGGSFNYCVCFVTLRLTLLINSVCVVIASLSLSRTAVGAFSTYFYMLSERFGTGLNLFNIIIGFIVFIGTCGWPV